MNFVEADSMKKKFVTIIVFVLFQSCAKEYSFEGGRGRGKDSLIIIAPNLDTAQKPVSDSTLKDTSFLVKNYVEKRGNTIEEYNFSYDSEGRLVSKISATGINRFIYQYNADNTFTMNFFKGSTLSVHQIYYLNNYNLVDSLVTINYDTKNTISEKYLYNANKLLVEVKEYNIVNARSVLTNTTTAEYDANGNVTKERNAYNNQISYQYTSLPYNLNIGLNFFSRNKNLVQTSTYSGSRNMVLNHSYTFDNFKRLTSETVTDANGDIVMIKKYSY